MISNGTPPKRKQRIYDPKVDGSYSPYDDDDEPRRINGVGAPNWFRQSEYAPNDVDAEADVVGMVFYKPDCFPDAAHVPADAFFDPRHSRIWAAARTIHHQGKLPDATQVAAWLHANGGLDNDLRWYIDSLAVKMPTAVTIKQTADYVAEIGSKRRLWYAIHETAVLIHRGAPIGDVEERLRDQVYPTANGEKTNAVEIEAVDSKTFFAERYVVDYMVENVLTVGQPQVIGGPSKSLKTSIMIDLALSVATGNPFLGRYRVLKSCTVGIMSGESGKATLQAHAKRVAYAKGIDPAETPIYWSFAVPKLSDAEALDALRRFIEKHSIKLLFVDPLYMALLDAQSANQAGNVYAMGSRLAELSRIIEETGCTIVVLHHTVKMGKSDARFDPLELESLSQSGICEWARGWILINRRSQWVPDTPHHLWLSIGGSAGHASQIALNVDEGNAEGPYGRCWRLEIEDASDVRAKAKTDKVTGAAAAIKMRLETSKQPMSKTQLREATGLGNPAVTAGLDYLTDPTRNLIDVGSGKRGRQMCELYGLKDRHGDPATWGNDAPEPPPATESKEAA